MDPCVTGSRVDYEAINTKVDNLPQKNPKLRTHLNLSKASKNDTKAFLKAHHINPLSPPIRLFLADRRRP